jgi:hypothetical protein
MARKLLLFTVPPESPLTLICEAERRIWSAEIAASGGKIAGSAVLAAVLTIR